MDKQKQVFLIRPVRNCASEFAEGIAAYVRDLEARDYLVHDPPRDTPQDDPTGLNICRTNRAAIEAADEVHFCWDEKSQGCLFDLGMAFALRKKIVPVVGLMPKATKGKSFQNMVYAYAEDEGERTMRRGETESKTDLERYLEESLPAVANIDHGCSFCVTDYIEAVNPILEKMGCRYRYHLKGRYPKEDLVLEKVDDE